METLKNIVCFIGIVICAVAFIKGLAPPDPPKKKKKKKLTQFLHCFQCEIDMPVKEKNGKKYCENCGLLHANDYV